MTQTIQTLAHYISRPYPSQGAPLWLDSVVSLRRSMLGFAIGAAPGMVLGKAISANQDHLTHALHRSSAVSRPPGSTPEPEA